MDKNFWKAALIRAIRTVAQTAIDIDGNVIENKKLTTAYVPEE